MYLDELFGTLHIHQVIHIINMKVLAHGRKIIHKSAPKRIQIPIAVHLQTYIKLIEQDSVKENSLHQWLKEF